MNTMIALLAPTLPTGYCPSTWQDFANELFNNATAQFQGTTANFQYNIGSTTPTGDLQNYPWLRISNTDPELNGWYTFISGMWLRRHPYPPEGVSAYRGVRLLWVGTDTGAGSVDEFDGGETGVPVGAAAGPMWQVDTAFAGRSPMGPGLIPDVAPAKTLAVEENYGEGAHTLVEAELPAHVHTVPAQEDIDTNAGSRTIHIQPPEGNTTRNTSSVGNDTPFNIVHPVRGIYVIKRTDRIWYRAA